MGLLTPKNTEDLAQKVISLQKNHEAIFKSSLDIGEFKGVIKDLLKDKKDKWVREQFNSLSITELLLLSELLNQDVKKVQSTKTNR